MGQLGGIDKTARAPCPFLTGTGVEGHAAVAAVALVVALRALAVGNEVRYLDAVGVVALPVALAADVLDVAAHEAAIAVGRR